MQLVTTHSTLHGHSQRPCQTLSSVTTGSWAARQRQKQPTACLRRCSDGSAMQPRSSLAVGRLSSSHVCLTALPVLPAPALRHRTDPCVRCRLSSPNSRRGAPFQGGRHRVGRSRQAVRSDASFLQQAVTTSSQALGWLHSSPALQDTCATVTAVLGAAALIKAFDALTQAGWLDQVRDDCWCASAGSEDDHSLQTS